MKPLNSSTSLCRSCRYYTPEGRRGGYCSQLNVAVQSGWKACALAIPPFTPSWESLDDIMLWQQKTLTIQEVTMSNHSAPEPEPTCAVEEVVAEEVAVSDCLSTSSRQVTGIKALWM